LRIFNVAKIGVLLLCILLVIPMMTGCANESFEQVDTEVDEQELLVQVEKKWNAVIENIDGYVAKIEIAAYVSQSMASSFGVITQDITIEDSNVIDSLLAVFDMPEMKYEPFPSDVEQLDQYIKYMNSRAGKETISISFFDKDGQRILRLLMYEDNLGSLYTPSVTSAGDEAWQGVYYVSFSDQIFDLLKFIYDNEIMEETNYEENN